MKLVWIVYLVFAVLNTFQLINGQTTIISYATGLTLFLLIIKLVEYYLKSDKIGKQRLVLGIVILILIISLMKLATFLTS